MRPYPILKYIQDIAVAIALLAPVSLYAQPAEQNTEKPKENIHIAAVPEDMFIDLKVPEHQIYLGETIRIEYDVYVAASRGQIFYDAEEPDFSNWYSVEGKAPVASGVTIGGKPYTREPFAVFFVTPNNTGKLYLPQLKVQIPYLEEKPWITHEPRIIEVIPFPTPTPSGFSNGNVGQFSIQSKQSSNSIRVGDILSIQTEISGNAPVSHIDLSLYQLKSNTDAFKTYSVITESRDEQIIDNKLVSTKKYRLRLLALKPGRWTIDPFELVYFDPQRHQYQTLTSDSFQVNVSESGITPNTADPLSTTKSLDKTSIVPIHLKKASLNTPPSFWWMLLAPLLLGAIILMDRLRERRCKAQAESSENQLYMEKLHQLTQAKSSDEQLNLIRDLLAMRFHVDIGRSTDPLQPKLTGIFTEQQAKTIVQVLNELRMTSYSTQTPLDVEKLTDLVTILKTTRYVEPNQ
ncbi:MAG: BatD family protein [Proteobacteria bacterium]|nr:BatD family protein [Pseudomonadota bacterium]